MRITLVRHGETVGQSSIRYYGRTDVPLSDAGRVQMQHVRAALAGESFDAVFSSRLRRSTEAAQLIASGWNVPVTPVPSFDEVDFGRWAGWTREEIVARDPENYRMWQEESGTFHYPEGESRTDFAARVARGLRELLASSRHDSILLVLHRGVILVILTELLDLGAEQRAELAVELGSIHVVRRTGSRWRSLMLDRVDHLPSTRAVPEQGRA